MIKRANEIETVTKSAMLNGPGEVTFHHLANKEELLDHARLFSILHLEKGCGIGYHVHENESELFYIVKGSAVYNDNGTESVVNVGDVMVCPPATGHCIRCNGDETCELVAVIVYA